MAKVVACFFFLAVLVERIGRKGSLMAGAFLMGALFLIVAIITATHSPNPDATGISSYSVASLTMIYLEASKWRGNSFHWREKKTPSWTDDST